MLRSHLKIAWRNLLKNKGYTVINIVGLAVGVCCFILIALFVKNEFSYDGFHSKATRIYRVWQHETYGPKEDFVNTVTPVSMGHVLKDKLPEIEEGTRVYRFNSLVKRSDNEFNEAIRAVDPAFFQIFDFKQVEGNPESPFAGGNSIVLSKATAERYFGKENPIGQTLELNFDGDVRFYEVSGVMANPPQESSIQFDFLVSLENEALFFNEGARQSWFNVAVETYLLLKPNQSVAQLEAKFPEVIKDYLGNNYEENTFFLHLQPLTEIHLDTSLPAGLEPISDPKYSYVMATIGLLVLLLACINYITLAVGRSFSRAVEVGVRKAMGAFHKQIVFQFWGEAVLITLFAVAFGIVLSYIFLGTFNELTGKVLHMSFDAGFWLVSLGLLVFIALVAGIYPSLLLSRFNPIEVLRRNINKGSSLGMFGRGLIVVQFAASIVMIVSTLVVGRQINFLINKDLGYKKDAIVVVPTNKSGEEAQKIARVYIEAIKKDPQVAEACASIYSMIENFWFEVGFTDGKNNYREFAFNGIDPGFLETYNIQMASGRDFQEGNVSDREQGVLVNETFVREFGLEHPIGTVDDTFGVTILGVVKDFNFQSLNYRIKPLMLAQNPNPILDKAENIEAQYNNQPRVSVRLASKDMTANIAMLKKTWEELNPSQEFEYSFLDASLSAQYQSEQRSKTIVYIASVLSIFIACLGLFGLATLNVARRTAEIGIRKVMGASVWNIVGMIARDFIKLAVTATVFAFPIAWWAMHHWLQDFAYSISISWWIFALAGLLTVLITLLSIGFQAIRAAMATPVKSLRTE